MDYSDEQQLELEALEAIFADELQLQPEPPAGAWPAVGNTFKIVVTPQEDGEGGLEGADELEMELLWAHTARYPEEAPCLRLRASRGLSDADVDKCRAVLMQQVEENKGMAMIYTLVTAAKEWLRGRATETQVEPPEVAARRAAAEEEAKRAAIRAMGTMVTPENFLQWKAKFDAEMAAAKAKALEGAADNEKSKRMTGKQWFMQERIQEAKDEQDNEEAASSDDGEGFEDESLREGDAGRGGDEEDDEDIDYDDDDDEGMLDAQFGGGGAG